MQTLENLATLFDVAKPSTFFARAHAATITLMTLMLSLAACTTTPTIESAADIALQKGTEILYGAPDRFQYPEAVSQLEQAASAGVVGSSFPLAYAYTKIGKYEEAGDAAKAALTESNDWDVSQQRWIDAIIYKADDQIEKEVMAWQEAAQANPNDRWTWYELSSALSAVGKYAEAAEAAERALAIEPDPSRWGASWIYYLHSKALYRAGNPKAAVGAAEAGKTLPTTWRSTYFRKMLGALATDPDDMSDKADNDFENDYRAISETEGRNSAAYTELNLAMFFFELGDYERAATLAQAGLDMQSSSYGSWTLSFSLTESGEAEKGLVAADEGIATTPDNNFLHAARGWALYRLGKIDAATEAFEMAKKVSARRNHQIEEMAAAVQKARVNRSAPPAPRIPWLG